MPASLPRAGILGRNVTTDRTRSAVSLQAGVPCPLLSSPATSTKSFGPQRRARPRVVHDRAPAAGSASSRPTAPARSTLLRILAGLDAPDSGHGHAHAADARPSATCPRSPSGAPGETVRAYLGRRTGVAARRAALDAARRRRSPTADAGADDAYADALERYLALGARRLRRPRRRGVRRPRAPGHGCSISTMPRALGRPGGAGEPRRDPARPLRRVPARRADERPRLRRPRTARAVPARRAARRRGDRVARPRVPRPHDHARARARRAHALGAPSTPAAGRRTSTSARPRARHAEEDYADVRGAARRRCATARSASGSGRCRARRRSQEVGRDRQVHPRTSGATAASTSPPRRRSPTGRSNGSRRTRSTSRGRAGTSAWRSRPRPAAAPSSRGSRARSCERGDFTLGPVDLEIGYGERVAILGRERQRQDDAARRARSAGARSTAGDALARARASSSASSTRPAPRSRATSRCSPRFERASGLLPSEARSLLAKFGLGAEHVDARRPTRSRPASAPRASLALLGGAGRQLPRARRADEPPRPARDRAARISARGQLRGHAAARHPRPARRLSAVGALEPAC